MFKYSRTIRITDTYNAKHVAIPTRILLAEIHTPQTFHHPYYNYYVNNQSAMMVHVELSNVQVSSAFQATQHFIRSIYLISHYI